MEVEKSSNMFKYDNPIGRKQFLINFLFILAIAFIVLLLLGIFVAIIKYFFSVNVVTLPIINILCVLAIIFIQYLVIINEAKRLYDIISDKSRALLYTILFGVIVFSLLFFSKTIIVSQILRLVFLLFLLFKKGSMQDFETETVTENETVDSEPIE